MQRQGVRQRFDQSIAAGFHEFLHFGANGRIIHGSADVVIPFVHRSGRPKRQVKREALRGAAFFVGHADMRENFQLFDVNLIVHANGNLPETIMGASANAFIWNFPPLFP